MKNLSRILLPVFISTILFGNTSDVFAEADEAAQHEAVLAYWTSERMAEATPGAMLSETAGGLLNSLASILLEEDHSADVLSETDGASWEAGAQVRRSVGRVFLTLSGRDRVCTGTVVQDFRFDRSIVLTAGHCTYDPATKTFATNWMFIPAFTGSTSLDCDTQAFGCWTADHFVTSRKFANRNLEGDYAFAVLGLGGHSGRLPLDAVVDAQSVVFERDHPAQVYAFAYPTAEEFEGDDLVYCAGMTVADTWAGSSNFGVRCSMNDGASGGPWMADFNEDSCSGSVNSVTSFRYVAGPLHEYLFGPYFDAATRRTFVAAQTSSGNEIVN